LATTVIGLVLIVVGVWRAGLAWIGAGLLVASITRLVLPERISGMLRVRRKWSDVLMLLIAGVALIVLSVIVPNQPGA
jgi:multisubunit Na+/H+ antiporter MnhB subunit